MKKEAWAALVLSLAVFAWPSRARAQCPDSIDFDQALNMLAGNFTGLPEADVTGRVFELSNPSAYLEPDAFLCLEDGTRGGWCSYGSGNASDGAVNVSGDWRSPAAHGCPVVAASGDAPAVTFLTSIE